MNELSTFFKALSDPTRLRILNLLLEAGELCVCDLESTLGCTQTKISRHMGYLRRAGLTSDRKSGRWVYYSIALPKSPMARATLKNLREHAATEPRAARDTTELNRRIAAGCCVSKPQQ